MFKEETVFILGAGASWHYGYPTGEDLVKMVIEKAENLEGLIDRKKDILGCQSCWPKIFHSKIPSPQKPEAAGLNERFDALQSTKEDCHTLAKALSYVKPIVIDNFLGQNPKLATIGKFLVAWVMLDCERRFYVSDKRHNFNRRKVKENSPEKSVQDAAGSLDISKYKDDWCRFLIHRLSQKPAQLLSNKVTFVTFNYDASLERTLYQGLSHIEAFQNEKVNIMDFFTPDRFLHMYGRLHDEFAEKEVTLESIGSPPNDKRDTATYEYWKSLFNSIYECSERIFTIEDCQEKGGDKNKCEEVKTAAQEKIKNAKFVYILGYGFDERNSERLGLSHALRDKSHGTRGSVYFTNFGDRNVINKKSSKIFFERPDKFLPPNYIQSPGNGSRYSYYEKSTRDVYEALEMDFDF